MKISTAHTQLYWQSAVQQADIPLSQSIVLDVHPYSTNTCHPSSGGRMNWYNNKSNYMTV